jgi:hypothetical protein
MTKQLMKKVLDHTHRYGVQMFNAGYVQRRNDYNKWVTHENTADKIYTALVQILDKEVDRDNSEK